MKKIDKYRQSTVVYLKFSVWAGTQKAVVAVIVGIIFCLSSSFVSDKDTPAILFRQT